jgi:hypothetical protein
MNDNGIAQRFGNRAEAGRLLAFHGALRKRIYQAIWVAIPSPQGVNDARIEAPSRRAKLCYKYSRQCSGSWPFPPWG